MEKKIIIYPKGKKIVLSRDESVRIGKYVIGRWFKEYVAGSSHYRSSELEGNSYYVASLANGENINEWTMSDLRNSIYDVCKDGIEIEVY